MLVVAFLGLPHQPPLEKRTYKIDTSMVSGLLVWMLITRVYIETIVE